jgi:hypothetical protein
MPLVTKLGTSITAPEAGRVSSAKGRGATVQDKHTQTPPLSPVQVRALLGGDDDLSDASRAWRWQALAGKPGMRSPQQARARNEGWHIVVPESEVSNGDA